MAISGAGEVPVPIEQSESVRRSRTVFSSPGSESLGGRRDGGRRCGNALARAPYRTGIQVHAVGRRELVHIQRVRPERGYAFGGILLRRTGACGKMIRSSQPSPYFHSNRERPSWSTTRHRARRSRRAACVAGPIREPRARCAAGHARQAGALPAARSCRVRAEWPCPCGKPACGRRRRHGAPNRDDCMRSGSGNSVRARAALPHEAARAARAQRCRFSWSTITGQFRGRPTAGDPNLLPIESQSSADSSH